MRRPRILLDVDGPLTKGFADGVCDLLRKHGIDASSDRIDHWDIFTAFKTPKPIELSVRAEMCARGVAYNFEMNPGAWRFIDEVRDWADIYAVTSPLDGSPTWAHDRERWFCDLFGFEPKRVISTRDKAPIRGDALVDDKPEHLVAWQAENPTGLAILWRETYNASSDWTGPSVGGYEDLRRYLDALRAGL